jgi:type IX secretion system PorP/SprF family membrane protein
MKKIITSIALTITAVAGFAQQDQQFSQYMQNKLTYNPGYAGTSGGICTAVMYRQQWLQFPGAPKTMLVNFDAPVLQNTALRGGAGLTIMQDQLGNDNSLFARGAYSYHLPVGAVGKLGIGVDAGMIQKKFKDNWFAPDGTDGASDPSIPTNQISSITYDVNFGLYYTTSKLYIGLAASHLPGQVNKKTDGTKSLEFKNAQHIFLNAGYEFDLSSDFKLIPSVLVKSDLKATIFDAGVNVMYRNMVWLGGAYRMTDAIATMLGYQYVKGNNVLKIGVAYDVTLSDLKNYSSNTFEVLIGYCFKPVPKTKKQSHINPRFLK